MNPTFQQIDQLGHDAPLADRSTLVRLHSTRHCIALASYVLTQGRHDFAWCGIFRNLLGNGHPSWLTANAAFLILFQAADEIQSSRGGVESRHAMAWPKPNGGVDRTASVHGPFGAGVAPGPRDSFEHHGGTMTRHCIVPPLSSALGDAEMVQATVEPVPSLTRSSPDYRVCA